MAVIGITLNEVLRDFTTQFIYVYEKYKEEVDLDVEDVTNFNLLEHFNFESFESLNKFIYTEASLELFGHADQVSDNLMHHFNMFLMDIKDDEEHTVEIVVREVDKAIPSTLFFLSKLGCRINRIRFVNTYEDIWDGLDVLISANPVALDLRPEGKLTIKIKTPYNEDADADFELSDVSEFLTDESLRNRILNSEIKRFK